MTAFETSPPYKNRHRGKFVIFRGASLRPPFPAIRSEQIVFVQPVLLVLLILLVLALLVLLVLVLLVLLVLLLLILLILLLLIHD